MNWLPRLGEFAGGLGLFLLGMGLMTDGLKLAAGNALQRILGQWTRSRGRGLASGMLITAVVQSSSAVTVATIGFVNAGILTLAQAVWVIFGANVGTSATGWLVALVGFKFKIEAFALPLVGIGMLLRLSGEQRRRGALGSALAGFGVLFFGIALLKSAFSGLDALIDADALQAEGLHGIAVFTLLGVLLTAIMQSSSAAIAIALTAVAGGLVPLAAGGAVVIGANVGTTVTAVLAAIGATSSARRTAAAHVVFNLCTAVVALLALPLMLATTAAAGTVLGMAPDPTVVLAMFHTGFNLLGVLLMWPTSAKLVAFLEQRFRTVEEDESRPQYLDKNVLQVPSIAIDALGLETRRLGTLALTLADDSQRGHPVRDEIRRAVDRLARTIAEFAARLNQAKLSPDNAEALPELLRVVRYYDVIAGLAGEISSLGSQVRSGHATDRSLAALADDALAVLAAADTAADGFSQTRLETRLDDFEQRYQDTKVQLLRAGAQGSLSVSEMDDLLQHCSLSRRMVDQSAKAARRLAGLASIHDSGDSHSV